MFADKGPLATLAVAASLAGAVPILASSASALARPSAHTQSGVRKPTARERALLDSRELWATIDVCNPADQRNTVGIRGSMPGDGNARDRMYMSFRVQYMNSHSQWVSLSEGASSGWVAVGNGNSPRQGGTSFELKPVAGKPAVELRGVVDFQWRRGKTLMQSTTEPTSTGHRSLAGADPAGFSAATCVIG
jgi:hypothetical protein